MSEASDLKTKIKAVVFDMDGVILYSETISDITWRMAAEQKGLPINPDILNSCRGTNKNDSMAILKTHYGNDFDSAAFL